MNDISDTKYVKVFIGRFQPFHLGHLKVLRAAIDTADVVVVMVGSAQLDGSSQHPFSHKNPWSWTERRFMIAASLTPKERQKVTFGNAYDKPGQDAAWVKAVKADATLLARQHLGWSGKLRFTLIGCHKGSETYYLKLYRNWSQELIPRSEALNATDVREAYFNALKPDLNPDWLDIVPGGSAGFLLGFRLGHRERYYSMCRQLEAQCHQQLEAQRLKETP